MNNKKKSEHLCEEKQGIAICESYICITDLFSLAQIVLIQQQ